MRHDGKKLFSLLYDYIFSVFKNNKQILYVLSTNTMGINGLFSFFFLKINNRSIKYHNNTEA